MKKYRVYWVQFREVDAEDRMEAEEMCEGSGPEFWDTEEFYAEEV